MMTGCATASRPIIAAAFPMRWGWAASAWLADGHLAGVAFGYRSRAAAQRAVGRSLPCQPIADTLDWQGCEQLGGPERRLAERLIAYAEGAVDDFRDVTLAFGARATPFQRAVIAACRQIGYGTTLSYTDLAARAGRPGAARAAGTVMARNRWPIVVACHRVVGSSGRLGGYSAPSGLAMKRRLLKLEAFSAKLPGPLLGNRRQSD